MANNTALRAGKDTTRTITFKNKEHEKILLHLSAKVQISGCIPQGIGVLSWN